MILTSGSSLWNSSGPRVMLQLHFSSSSPPSLAPSMSAGLAETAACISCVQVLVPASRNRRRHLTLSVYKQIIVSDTSDQWHLWKPCSGVYVCLCGLFRWFLQFNFCTFGGHLLLCLLLKCNVPHISNVVIFFRAELSISLPLFLCQFNSGSAVTPQIMTGNRRAAPSAPGTPATPTHLPNATSTPDQKQSGVHSPNKFMSGMRRIHSELDA